MKYKATIITISDKGSKGERVDKSGPAIAEMLKDALPTEHALGVFANRSGRGLLGAAAAGNRRERIDVAAGEEHEARVRKPAYDQARQKGIHGPRLRLMARSAEFHAHHVDDVGYLG